MIDLSSARWEVITDHSPAFPEIAEVHFAQGWRDYLTQKDGVCYNLMVLAADDGSSIQYFLYEIIANGDGAYEGRPINDRLITELFPTVLMEAAL